MTTLPSLNLKSPKCTAQLKSGAACPNFARKNGRCRRHGGLSTGPRSVEGKAAVARAQWKHGHYSLEKQKVYRNARYFMRECRAFLRYVESTLPKVGRRKTVIHTVLPLTCPTSEEDMGNFSY